MSRFCLPRPTEPTFDHLWTARLWRGPSSPPRPLDRGRFFLGEDLPERTPPNASVAYTDVHNDLDFECGIGVWRVVLVEPLRLHLQRPPRGFLSRRA